ncbi:UNVERIFIED_CONTAM: hypothetical protein BEN50_11065 [Euhalothece sp. KZN 001]
MNNYIYELRDITDDEVYYSLGIFQNIRDAREVITSVETSEEPISWYVENKYNYEHLVLVKRPFGLFYENEDYKEVLIIKREERYNEKKDCYEWKRI